MNAIKLKLAALPIVATLGLYAFIAIKPGSIKGSVTPANAAVKAWAISGSDTLKASIDRGSFTISEAKPGVYRVIIEAMPPYKNMAEEGVAVNDGQQTDIGEIRLQQ
jgi:hypothetical protein